MKNRRQNKSSWKITATASAIGVAAVAVTAVAAYQSVTRRMIPTATNTSTNVWSYTPPAESDVQVQKPITNVPKDNDSKPQSSSNKTPAESQSAEQVNKPVNTTIGNIMPVEGEVSNPFSNGELVKSQTLGVWKSHDGCDILCDLGTEVKSMSEGVVKQIENHAIWGVTVTIEQSNGLTVQYCGLAKELNVKNGAQVKQGEIIGKTGDTNQAEILQEPHLHIGVKQGDKWIDPMSVIS